MTINDIAKLANVSPATVSLAINNRAGVNAGTRQKILDIAKKNGYFPQRHTNARNGSINKAIKLIAISKPDTSDIHNFKTSFFADIIDYTQKRCAELGYSLIYSTISYTEFIDAIKQSELEQPSSGIILLGTYLDDNEIEQLHELGNNIVLMDRNCPLELFNTVSINNYMGAYKATKYFINLGHKNIGYIHSTARIANLRERQRGVIDALKDNDLSLAETHSFQVNSYMLSSVDLMVEKLSKCTKLPTAFFCDNDYNAICLMNALARLGHRVPEDVSVIGFDDVPECLLMSPLLTTIHASRRSLAYAAVDRLHAILSSPNPPVTRRTEINVKLIVRNSVAPVSK